MPTALITGASAGIGAAFARRLASEHYDLVLVARDVKRLQGFADELSGEHGITTEALVADLSDIATGGGCASVEKRLADGGIDLLVNNAGFTTHAPFDKGDVEDEDRMLRVNVRAVLRLAHAAVSAMLTDGGNGGQGGGIINVSSVAGFFPTAGGATYAASKAYVTALSEGLASEFTDRGVVVTALCPGFTRTEFHQRAGIETAGIADRMWLDADQLVDAALADHRRKRPISVPGWQYKVLTEVGRLTPRPVLATASRLVKARRGRH
ncbi:MAG TPA: SDR family NAD(P)-dependent oxidoreductase [Frankiaceae bacterium]|nr:SDR family NAD(P)-dependent oxidoreductase [Frankiaceae bacterium]